jgi:Fic family protein
VRDADFENSPVGHLVLQVTHRPLTEERVEYSAFMPDLLPDTVLLPPATYKVVSAADHALGELAGAAKRLPDPAVLIHPTVTREATATSALEGTFAELFDVFEAQNLPSQERGENMREILNAAGALMQGVAELKTFPIHFKLAARLQASLVRGTRGDGHHAGRIRDSQVFISGGDARDITSARFVPPPPGDELTHGIDQWEKWINADDDLPVIIKVAMGHYQFETLHPFRDGNGRVGRLIMLLQLIEAGRLEQPILNLSSYLEARKDTYRDLMADVSKTGAWAPWIEFIAEGVRTEAINASARIDKLMEFRASMIEALREHKIRGLARDIVDDLIANPIITAGHLKATHGVSWPTANGAIQKLADLGFLKEFTGRSYGKVYFAPVPWEIIQAN